MGDGANREVIFNLLLWSNSFLLRYKSYLQFLFFVSSANNTRGCENIFNFNALSIFSILVLKIILMYI